MSTTVSPLRISLTIAFSVEIFEIAVQRADYNFVYLPAPYPDGSKEKLGNIEAWRAYLLLQRTSL